MSQETFQKDQRVIFRRGALWYEGKINRVNCGDPNGDGPSYIVDEFYSISNTVDEGKKGDSYTIPWGDENIRILPYERPLGELVYKAMTPPRIFRDPHAALYMPNGNTGDGHIDHIIRMVSDRRKIVEGSINNVTGTPQEILDSVFQERDIQSLEELAKTDSSKMLQLADLYGLGMMGPNPGPKVTTYYYCAATGINEEEYTASIPFEWKFMYPMGNSEALTACAHQIFISLTSRCRKTGRTNWDDEFEYNDVFQFLESEYMLPEDSRKLNYGSFILLGAIAFFVTHAFRRGWLSPFALNFAEALSNHGHWIDFCQPFATQLEMLVEFRNSKIPVLRDASPEMAGTDFSVFPQFQLECFAPKAIEIFLDLPVKAINGTGDSKYLTDIHIEYRQLDKPPYSMVVNVFHLNKVYYSAHVPDQFKCIPFTEAALEYMWGCVVFSSMHRGELWNGDRFRPAVITFPDRPNDRLFASYVKKAIGGDASGTEIQMVDTRRFMIKVGNETKSIRQAMDEAEIGFKRARTSLGNGQASDRFYNWKDFPIEELCGTLVKLKQEGDTCLLNGRVQAAKRCYTEAIDHIKTNVNVNEKVLIQLGTLLCDRAGCFLKLAEGMTLHPATTALKNGLEDCEKALMTKSCMRVLPSSVKKDIADLKSILAAKIQSLSSPSTDRTVAQGPPSPLRSQPQHRRAKKGSKKQRKKQKLKQRRRQRQQRTQKEEKTAPSEGDSLDRDDDREVLSIVTGNDLWESKVTPFVSGREDTCPCCFDRFSVELGDVFCLVNPCGHACCLPCLSVLKKKSQKGSAQTDFNCPVCRIPISKDVLTNAVDPIVSCTPYLEDRIVCLPLKEMEATQVAKELCLRHDFKIPVVLSALDMILTDGLQASLRSSKNLTSTQKQEIYEEARGPVDVLWAEAKELQHEMYLARDLESESYLKGKQRLTELQTTLIPVATKKAVDFIWEKMNSSGSMGIEDRSSGEIEIDFHALHVNEAKERFHEQVVPILPAVESVLLVVGRGNHSEGGAAKLGPALKKLIENHSKMRHSRVEGNDGMIRVQWLP